MDQTSSDLIKANPEIWNCSAAKYFGVTTNSVLFKQFLDAVKNNERKG